MIAHIRAEYAGSDDDTKQIWKPFLFLEYTRYEGYNQDMVSYMLIHKS